MSSAAGIAATAGSPTTPAAIAPCLRRGRLLPQVPEPAPAKAGGAAAKDWLAARQADLLPVDYFHVIFTLPAEIAPIAYQNKAVVYDLLFRATAETLLTIAADPRRPPRLHR